jgi:hypothetical protein
MTQLDANAGVATMVSSPSGTVGNMGPATASAAPGAQGPGGGMSVTTAVVYLILGSAVTLVAIGVAFRRPIGER